MKCQRSVSSLILALVLGAPMLGSALGGCRKDRSASASGQEQEGESLRASSTAVMSAAAEEPAAPGAKRAPQKPAASGQQVSISGGSFLVGSTPGDRGRDPTLEPSLWKTDLGTFSIDRLPYPNDPSQPPKTNVTQQQARELCAQRGQRLCTELEWERACKGPQGEMFSTGAGWDTSCEQRASGCASAEDVLGLGASIREWTSGASEAAEPGASAKPLAVLRGARAGAAVSDHRCARRELAEPGASGADIGFRCCSGTANDRPIAKPKALAAFRRVQLDPEQVTSMIQSVPQLASLGAISFFKEPDAVNQVLGKGDAGKGGNTLTTSALIWSPDLGEEILVLTGKGASGSSFIAAFYRLADDRYRLASSFVLQNEEGPIILAFNGWVRQRLTWSTCWGCMGEEGAIIYRKERQVVIEQL